MNTLDFIRSQGVVYEDDYPYTGTVATCNLDTTQSLFKTIGFEVITRDEGIIQTIVGECRCFNETPDKIEFL